MRSSLIVIQCELFKWLQDALLLFERVEMDFVDVLPSG